MKIFSLLKALMQLVKCLRSLEQTLIAQIILKFPELRSMNLDAKFRRKDIISPLLLELYEHHIISTSGEDEDAVVDSIANWEKRNKEESREEYGD